MMCVIITVAFLLCVIIHRVCFNVSLSAVRRLSSVCKTDSPGSVMALLGRLYTDTCMFGLASTQLFAVLICLSVMSATVPVLVFSC